MIEGIKDIWFFMKFFGRSGWEMLRGFSTRLEEEFDNYVNQKLNFVNVFTNTKEIISEIMDHPWLISIVIQPYSFINLNEAALIFETLADYTPIENVDIDIFLDPMKDNREAFKQLVTAITQCKTLVTLGLQNNSFKNHELNYLVSEVTKECPHISGINLANNLFDDEGVRSLAQFPGIINLSQLHLSDHSKAELANTVCLNERDAAGEQVKWVLTHLVDIANYWRERKVKNNPPSLVQLSLFKVKAMTYLDMNLLPKELQEAVRRNVIF